MERYNNIISNEEFIVLLKELENIEITRQFCRHGLTHLLDVCRIMYIEALENGYDISKDVIYAAGLLHDIGRVAEYKEGKSHHDASAEFAEMILPKTGYSSEEAQIICAAVKSHRNEEATKTALLSKLLYDADKKSRMCFWCDAIEDCKWSNEKKNFGVVR